MNTLDIKEGQTYICTKAWNESWWTEGKEYNVVCNTYGIPTLVDDVGYKWTAKRLSAFRNEFKLKENTKMSKLELKEGQTYVCKRDDLDLGDWTLGKEYKVQAFSNGDLYITDDNEYHWYLPIDNLLNNVFKLKEQPFDLNKLTTAQLKEYTALMEDKEKVESALNEFMERMTK